MSKASDEFRKRAGENDDQRDFGLKTPFDIVRKNDIVYGMDRKQQVLDVYRPMQADDEALPVIISFHGGGWVYGDKDRYQFYCMSLAQRGFAVVNFSYRLAPETKYPAPLEDMNLVAAWVMKRARKYNFDTKNIFGIGDSAGAHMLSLYAEICTNPEYAAKYSFSVPEGFALKALALNCGFYDAVTDPQTHKAADALLQDFLPLGGTEEECLQINVIKNMTEAFPPCYICTSNDDFLRTQAPVLARKLSSFEIPFILRRFGTKTDRLGHVFMLNITSWYSTQCSDDETDFFREFIDL